MSSEVWNLFGLWRVVILKDIFRTKFNQTSIRFYNKIVCSDHTTHCFIIIYQKYKIYEIINCLPCTSKSIMASGLCRSFTKQMYSAVSVDNAGWNCKLKSCGESVIYYWNVQRRKNTKNSIKNYGFESKPMLKLMIFYIVFTDVI